MRATEEIKGSTGVNAAINVCRVNHESDPQQPPETISMEISYDFFNYAYAKLSTLLTAPTFLKCAHQ